MKIGNLNFFPYPELLNDRRKPTATDQHGTRDREAPIKSPKGWQSINPKSLRSELRYNIPPLDDAAKRAILATA